MLILFYYYHSNILLIDHRIKKVVKLGYLTHSAYFTDKENRFLPIHKLSCCNAPRTDQIVFALSKKRNNSRALKAFKTSCLPKHLRDTFIFFRDR